MLRMRFQGRGTFIGRHRTSDVVYGYLFFGYLYKSSKKDMSHEQCDRAVD